MISNLKLHECPSFWITTTFNLFQVTGFLKQQSQEISKSSLVQQLNIAKSNAGMSMGSSDGGLSTIDPKQQEIKQVETQNCN